MSSKVLSCTSCRERKTKCDKVQPFCTQCSRAGLQCVYPSRKPTRRAPRPRQRELLDRISRLESIVGQVDPDKIVQLNAGEVSAAGPGASSEQAMRDETSSPRSADSTDAASRYLSGEFWGNLCEEVEGIKQALDQPSDENEDDEDQDSPESAEAAAARPRGPGPAGCFLLASLDYQEQEPLAHPTEEKRVRLWNIYTRNVDPLMKILHRPTVAKELAALSQRVPHPATNAVLFCVYLAAVTSLTPEACIEQLGERYNDVLFKYRCAAERAMAAADYLNSTDMRALQAFAIYVSMLRCQSHGRSSWALTSLLIRLAQAINLHRDGDGQRFSPFEAEMRRRLWHFILVLDIRGSEDRGSDAIVVRSSWNTAVPTAIDDEEFSPTSIGPLIPKVGPAENVVLLCTSMCSSIFGYLQHPATNVSGEAEAVFTEEELIKHVRRLEDDFIHKAVPSHLPSRYASEVARMVILKLWLAIQYPFTATSPVSRPRVSRETMLRTAVSVMELSERMESHPWTDRFSWWTATYIQWHPLAVALAELCLQTEGDLVRRSWEVIDRVFPVWRHGIADSYTGTLWRPIKKLYKRAKEARVKATKQLRQNKYPPPPTTLAPQSSVQAQSQLYMVQGIPAQEHTDMGSGCPSYDSSVMDPSYLFEYPQELSSVDFSQLAVDPSMHWSPWVDFLNDTQMDLSPEGSGSAGGDSM